MLPVIILGIIFLIKEISMIKSFEIEKVDTTETL
jgi:hypothetical protein